MAQWEWVEWEGAWWVYFMNSWWQWGSFGDTWLKTREVVEMDEEEPTIVGNLGFAKQCAKQFAKHFAKQFAKQEQSEVDQVLPAADSEPEACCFSLFFLECPNHIFPRMQMRRWTQSWRPE